MPNIEDIFIKTDTTCSNSFLIDEFLCLANSLPIINSNTNTLSSAIEQLQQTADVINSIYSYFTIQSANWFDANNNINKYSSTWTSDYTSVNASSASWSNEFSIFYTSMYDINDWYASSATYVNVDINNWINLNFPTSDYADNQILSIYVNTYQDYPFILGNNFSASFHHNCIPKILQADKKTQLDNFSYTINCDGTTCAGNRPSRGCNHHGGAAGYGPCDNAYDHCNISTNGGGNVQYNCPANGADTLLVTDSGSIFYDRFIVTNFKLNYQKQPNDTIWTSQQ